jgi:iron complex transport system substrate-binding protein
MAARRRVPFWGSSPAAVASAAVTATPTAAPTASPTPVPAYPVTVTDDEGTAIALASEPKKIVSLTPAVTETLFAVGAGERVVATDDTSDYPAEAAPLPDVVTFGTVDVEKIVSLAPDLVIAGGGGFTSADSIKQMRALKILVLVVDSNTIETIYKDIELIGTAVGETDAAVALTTKMRADISAIGTATTAESAKAATPPRVFYDVGYIDTTGQIYAPAKGSFLAEMIAMLGVDVITGDAVTYEVPLETLIERDPQVIILGVNAFYTPTAEIIAKRTGWSKLTAVKNGDIRTVTDTEITRPGPRLATGMRNLALAMYPDLVLPSPAP